MATFSRLFLKEAKEPITEAYKGKHPKKIKSVSSDSNAMGVAHVELNDGSKHQIHAKDTAGVMPRVGEHISTYIKEGHVPSTLTEMEFTPHGGVVKPVPVPADNTTKPTDALPPYDEKGSHAPGLTEPNNGAVGEPIAKSLFSESQINALVEALRTLKE